MALINFSDIDCKQSINKTNKTIIFNNSEIEILNYLSAQDKYDLIMATLQKSFEDGIYNLVKMQIYFDLHLVLLFTNIVFSMEDREDEIVLYNLCAQSGLIDAVKDAIGEQAVNTLWNMVYQNAEYLLNYQTSFGGGVLTLVNTLGEKFENALNILKDINPDLVKKIVEEVNPHLQSLLAKTSNNA